MTERTARFEIVHTEGVKHPWHGRYRAANGEIVWWTELYADRRNVLRAIGFLAPLDHDYGDPESTFARLANSHIPVIQVDQTD